MERLYARERARWVRFRPSRELVRIAALTSDAARAVTSDVAERHERGLYEGRTRCDELSARLAAVAAGVAASPGERRLQRAYRDAEVALAEAHRLLQLGRPVPLAAALDSAEAALSIAEERVGDHLARLRDPQLRRAWQSLVDETVAATADGHPAVVVDKLRRRCVLVRDRKAVATWRAEFGRKGMLDKLYSGDGATPEGRYRISAKNAASRYHLALLLDYPNAEDRARFAAERRRGRVPAGHGPGGLIEIHGHGGRDVDWTDGCIALRDEDIEALFGRVAVGSDGHDRRLGAPARRLNRSLRKGGPQ